MVFVSKKSSKVSDYTVADIVGKAEKKGKVGIEVELEGRGFNRRPLAPWTYHDDGSLRGEDHAEYVLVRPLEFEEVDKALDTLWNMFKEEKTRIDESNRTSVHVHLNVLSFYQNRLAALMSLWFIVEDVLTHWCGETRVGNHYCLRAKDTPSVIHQLKKYVKSNGDIIPRENFHYAAFNAHAISKFGSVEIRTLRGVSNPAVIKTWVRILKRLYDASEEYTDPRFLIEEFSLRGPVPFFERLFGELSTEILTIAKLTTEQAQAMLYEGMRNAQDISYARDWSDFKPKKVERDPFGRKEKVVRGRQEDEFGVEEPVEAVEDREVREFVEWQNVIIRNDDAFARPVPPQAPPIRRMGIPRPARRARGEAALINPFVDWND